MLRHFFVLSGRDTVLMQSEKPSFESVLLNVLLAISVKWMMKKKNFGRIEVD